MVEPVVSSLALAKRDAANDQRPAYEHGAQKRQARIGSADCSACTEVAGCDCSVTATPCTFVAYWSSAADGVCARATPPKARNRPSTTRMYAPPVAPSQRWCPILSPFPFPEVR